MISVKRLLYSEKKRYGVSVDYYKVINSSSDILTGKKLNEIIKYSIKRAVFLKEKSLSQNPVLKRARQLHSNYGLMEVADLVLLMDARDFPKGFTPNKNDYVIIANERYEIKERNYIQEEQCYYFVLNEYKGSILYQVHERVVIDKLTLIQVIKPKHELLWTIVLDSDFLTIIDTVSIDVINS